MHTAKRITPVFQANIDDFASYLNEKILWHRLRFMESRRRRNDGKVIQIGSPDHEARLVPPASQPVGGLRAEVSVFKIDL